ncbi:hypothetical protein VTN00DRAFT_985 [Thermoascus crustaceus]|uniref:uncharacterized protein n=1 Tax=Thermoascus crustaceus TaxID=5088 RepID=UPI003742C65C
MRPIPSTSYPLILGPRSTTYLAWGYTSQSRHSSRGSAPSQVHLIPPFPSIQLFLITSLSHLSSLPHCSVPSSFWMPTHCVHCQRSLYLYFSLHPEILVSSWS